MARKSHNRVLALGIMRYSRSKMYSRRQVYKRTKPTEKPAKKPVEAKPTRKEVPLSGENNGGKRFIALKKAPRWYPTEDVSKPLKSHKTIRPTRLRASITPGTVLILLAGRFRGKRVVFLKQLKSGLLLVTGPFKINGVPLRRVNQAYVIATSTKVDIKGVKLNTGLTDAWFKREKNNKGKSEKTAAELFGEGKVKNKLPETKVAVQKVMDKQLLKVLEKEPFLKSYLGASFSLSKGQFPHALTF